MSKKFKIGDRVVMDSYGLYGDGIYFNKILNGSKGTVVNIIHKKHSNSFYIGVKWDDYVGGHTCSMNCKYGYGYYVDECVLLNVSETNKIKNNLIIPNNRIVMNFF